MLSQRSLSFVLYFFLTVAFHDLSPFLSQTEPDAGGEEGGKAEGLWEEEQQLDMTPQGLNTFKGNRWLRLVRAPKAWKAAI